MQKEANVFDHYGSMNESRTRFLEWLLPALINTCDLKVGLDVGCGVGFFSNFLEGMGINVTGLDARIENVAEAKKRYPGITFCVYDVEDPKVLELEPADMVLCFGLLYHLENPFRAIRNLHALAKKLVVIESMIVPHQLPVAALVDEGQGEDQSLNYVAFVSSEACLVKMLYRAGFEAVYKPQRLPDHDHFRASLEYRRRRTILVASKVKLTLPTLQELPEPQAENMWRKKWGSLAERLLRFLRKPLRAKPQTSQGSVNQ